MATGADICRVPPVAVAILAYGGQTWLERFLPSLLATDYPAFTVWVIDNGSTPPLSLWVTQSFPSVQVRRYEENLGYAGGYQRFFEEEGHTYPYLALLNSDVEVPPDWLSPLVDRLEAEPLAAAVQPKILSWVDRTAFEYAGAAGGLMDRWGYPTARGRGEKDTTGRYETPAEIFWAGGAAFVVRTAAILRDLRGLLFKPHYFMHMEEIDLCWRLQRAGWRIVYEPCSRIYHVGGASLPESHPEKTFYNFRNNLYLLYENLAPTERRRIVWRLVLDGAAGLYFLLKGRPRHTWAIVRAHQAFFRAVYHKALEPCSFLPHPPFRSLPGVTDRLRIFT